jgi:dTDP-glucose 4,6-dehydratase
MITNAVCDKPLRIYGDGKQQRDWLHVEDNCRGILAVLEHGRIEESADRTWKKILRWRDTCFA